MTTGYGQFEPHSQAKSPREVRYEQAKNLVEVLSRAGISILISTYQAGKLVVLGTSEGATRARLSQRRPTDGDRDRPAPQSLGGGDARHDLDCAQRDLCGPATLRARVGGNLLPHAVRACLGRYSGPSDRLGTRGIVDCQHTLLVSVHAGRETSTGRLESQFEFKSGVGEIFDVTVISRRRCFHQTQYRVRREFS